MKFLKWLGIVLAILLAAGFAFVKSTSQDVPKDLANEDPELYISKMYEALNKPAWDSLAYTSWTFMGNHHFFWNKRDNKVVVKWKEEEILMDLNTQKAIDLNNSATAATEKQQSKAWNFWCNDSFWFCAPFKVKDPGTSQSIVQMEDGNKGLMITYNSGGVTPGDKYMWILDEQNMPSGWKMWVKIIPMKGMYTSWEDYVTLAGGAKVASKHGNGKFTLNITNIKSGFKAEDIGYTDEIFNKI